MDHMDQLPEQTPPAAPSKDDCNIAMLAHLLGIFTGFVGALIIWLIKKDESSFINDQAKEALNFQITVAIGLIGAWILAFILIGFLLVPAIFLANFILCILAAIAASKGESYRYPFALRLVK
ncbi:MAG TPA: DUF4870 domain-containing protein [Paucimonas sp.]|nr:DUF4870 domain-containing protein [Paucimonas sp.]